MWKERNWKMYFGSKRGERVKYMYREREEKRYIANEYKQRIKQ